MTVLKEILGENTENLIFPDCEQKEHYIDSKLIYVIDQDQFEHNGNIYDLYVVRTVDHHYIMHARDDDYIVQRSDPVKEELPDDATIIDDGESEYLYIQNTLALAHEV